jgi:hypothetical protein
MNDRQIILFTSDNDNIRLVRNGLIIADNTPYDDWHNYGVALQFIATSIQFALGDWLNFGEWRYGEKYTQAIIDTPYTYGTLRNYAYVAGKVTLSHRSDNLSFAHHQEVAKLSEDEQLQWLDKAELDCLSVRQLRETIRQHQNGNTEPKANTCPNCGHEW